MVLPPTRATERAGALGAKADAVAARERMARENFIATVVKEPIEIETVGSRLKKCWMMML